MPDRIDAFATATEMLAALRAGRVSAVELLDLHRRRIERYNPTLTAIVEPDFEGAIGPYLEDRTPIGFTALVARELGGFTRPRGTTLRAPEFRGVRGGWRPRTILPPAIVGRASPAATT